MLEFLFVSLPRLNFVEKYLWILFHRERKVTQKLYGIRRVFNCKRFPVWRPHKCRKELSFLILSEILCSRASANLLFVYLPNSKAVFRSFHASKNLFSKPYNLAAFHPCRTTSFRWLHYREWEMKRQKYEADRRQALKETSQCLITERWLGKTSEKFSNFNRVR